MQPTAQGAALQEAYAALQEQLAPLIVQRNQIAEQIAARELTKRNSYVRRSNL